MVVNHRLTSFSLTDWSFIASVHKQQQDKLVNKCRYTCKSEDKLVLVRFFRQTQLVDLDQYQFILRFTSVSAILNQFILLLLMNNCYKRLASQGKSCQSVIDHHLRSSIELAHSA